MTERNRDTELLPIDLLTLIMKGDFRNDEGISTKEIDQVEQGLETYFPIDLTRCLAVISCQGNKGWEKAMFNPEESDSQPVVQAIAKIGMLAEYWGLVEKALDMNKLKASEYKGLCFIVISENDGQLSVLTTKLDVEAIALQRSEEAKYESAILLFNPGGDRDFWGSFKNFIFPMTVVREVDGSYQTEEVGREKLGINPQLVEDVWNVHNSLFGIIKGIYIKAVRMLAIGRKFPDMVQEIIAEKLEEEEEIGGLNDILNLYQEMVKRFGEEAEEDVFGQLRQSLDKVEGAVNNCEDFKSERQELMKAVGRVADGLGKMYKQAREFVGEEVYSYD